MGGLDASLGSGNSSSGNGNGSPGKEDVKASLLQPYRTNHAQDQQQREQGLTSFGSSYSLFLNNQNEEKSEQEEDLTTRLLQQHQLSYQLNQQQSNHSGRASPSMHSSSIKLMQNLNMFGISNLGMSTSKSVNQRMQQKQLLFQQEEEDLWNNKIQAALQQNGLGQLGSVVAAEGTMSIDANSNLKNYATWSGRLPPRTHEYGTYSCKVFLGGLPFDITEGSLSYAFKQFGSIKVEWPGKDNVANSSKGYAYIIFDNEDHVKSLLQACTRVNNNGDSWYYTISSRRMRSKKVQVIPWMINESNYVRSPQCMDLQKTVFVGALHGNLTAEGLAHIMDDLFGGVLYAGIHTNPTYKYPTGSGCVTFNNKHSYMKAVAAAFIDIKTPKFTKKVQVDPYLEDSLCASCSDQRGPYFCRDLNCLKYFCLPCWEWQHNTVLYQYHRPHERHNKSARDVTRYGLLG